ncbi:hypothetical protein A3A14_00805 [Candidatus Daviesbacteria bacterium RIFCSPLOWO2_01_FULL_43_38]|uniref:Glycosyltransferase 2-like domain-containing protein n=3 Tax=Candidatus Daviesiibacteriota TaxID=1752718 RepID=A0A1F5K6C5_9BACT|nr:MAG: Glycosyltransferase [Candidatus Daviesbacteria bacterium GW2011_GWA1_42_6]KKS71280.1 MAG: Glycosyltransferase [Candidatus Daviesbacteria bacterium GW2011_GWA2_42_7]OGE36459.1 MAG: hypothetical protein A3E45_00885 [Candidatus Daviesbacteria bacterium RIFCSPHIGHO2_12_FULL_43_11]OGE63504.1 MAG: hypothetical protein A3A14_00805 [Candidatus Daviesbacteria bacterium RIFCSPLOWO2_01_FULL_43_38]
MDKVNVKNLSVFFPAYNEEENIRVMVEKALLVLKTLKLNDYEVMVVNDGSTDGTAKVVEGLAKRDRHVRLINRTQNGGYGEALKCGLYGARFENIVYTDSDLQFDFSEVTKFLEKSEKADIVVGFRINRSDPPVRIIIGWVWTMLANALLGVGVKDVDCGFKLVKKKVIETIPKLESSRGGMISPELLAKAKKYGFKIIEVGVYHHPRQAGRQTGADLQVMIRSFADLLKLWWQLR